MGWKKVADDGIDLNLLDNEEESDSFNFEDLTKRLEKNQNNKND
jgi:hypothetical protein